MSKRENEGKKEKKEKRKQDGGLLLNSISVPRARTRACEGRRIACTCTFAEAGEAAMEIIDNCFSSLERDFRIWAWYCRHFDRAVLGGKSWRDLGIPKSTFSVRLKKVEKIFLCP